MHRFLFHLGLVLAGLLADSWLTAAAYCDPSSHPVPYRVHPSMIMMMNLYLDYYSCTGRPASHAGCHPLEDYLCAAS
jgi:hypothetical protein